ncbi:hypothetical protein O0L34_g10568 [Tuta absoluta]|nr:hypothetical protein O0L34_g10568 [Tuta absoluta]
MSICVSDEHNSPLNAVSNQRRRPNFPPQRDLQFEEFKTEIKKLFITFCNSQKEELAQLNTTMKEIKETNTNIGMQIAFVSAQNEELKLKINKLEALAREDREYIMFLEDRLDEMQLAYRKTNFEIKGVPKLQSETKQDLVDMVVTLSETLDCKINKGDIKDIYRVRSKKPEQRNTPIIVETSSALLKTNLLKMAKIYNIKNKSKLRAKHMGFKTQEETPIFLSENLTPKSARLFFMARDLAKSKHYKFVWTSYGKVYVRRTEEAAIIHIKTEQQIQNLLLEQI